jgi:hypothetical protein
VEISGPSTARCASALLRSLSDPERALAVGSLDDPRLTEWTYVPGDRPGLPVEGLDSEQHDIVMELLRSAHSPEGADLAVGAVAVERVRRELVTGTPPDGDRYWVRILGDPDGDQPWGWRINGHHLAVHVIVVDDVFTVTPHFLGSEPAQVPSGERLLGLEEDLARELASGLDPDQRTLGIASDRAPDDILTRHDPVADPTVLPEGIGRDELRTDQRDILDRLIRRYLERAPKDYADYCWAEALEGGDHQIRFAWAGPTEPGEGHYYCVSGPDFLIEYDNTQDNANHAHSVWRHLRDDWGVDLLRAHYQRGHAGRR